MEVKRFELMAVAKVDRNSFAATRSPENQVAGLQLRF
jgi:hypothetical protein